MVQIADPQIEVRTFAARNQKILVLTPEKAHTCLIAFPGFDGDLQIDRGIPRKLGYNFFVRNRKRFAELGFLVCIVDSPAAEKAIGLRAASQNRRTKFAVDSFYDLIKFLSLPALPVWLCGTSRSPEMLLTICNETSVARPSKPCDGLVLLSCLTADNDGTTSITKVPVENVRVPVLVVHHAFDECSVSNPGLVTGFVARINSVRKKLVLIESGESAEGADPCKGNARHGFWGADEEVIEQIKAFVRAET